MVVVGSGGVKIAVLSGQHVYTKAPAEASQHHYYPCELSKVSDTLGDVVTVDNHQRQIIWRDKNRCHDYFRFSKVEAKPIEYSAAVSLRLGITRAAPPPVMCKLG